jgi:hypothetical protein
VKKKLINIKMVYESDFYTTRRPYSRPSISSYSVTKREIPWEKVPFVPRPALIADPVTAWGKRKPKTEERRSILEKISRETIKPLPQSKLLPLTPYLSTRDKNRDRILQEVSRQGYIREEGGTRAMASSSDSMDILLPRLHGTTGVKYPKRVVHFSEPGYAYY